MAATPPFGAFVFQTRGGRSDADNPPLPGMDEDERQFLELLNITPRHQAGFLAYYHPENKKYPCLAAANAACVKKSTIRTWRHKEWWAKMYQRYVAGSTMDFHMALASAAPDIAQGLIDVAKGTNIEDRTANARVRAAEVYAKTAAAGQVPLLNTKPELNINNSTTNNLTIHGVLDHDKIRDLGRSDPAAILEMVHTGNIPEEYHLKKQG